MRWRLPFVLFVAVPLAQCAPVEEGDSGSPEAMKASVRRQIEENWIFDVGMPGAERMEATLQVQVNPDGTVQSVRIDDSGANSDPNWLEFAESCRRAVFRSSPLRMPASVPYEEWKRMTLVFSAKDLLGQGN
jgi:TonB C terminal